MENNLKKNIYTHTHIYITELLCCICETSTTLQINCESESEVTQSCPTLCDPVDCSLPGSSVHGILQARILEWVAISFSRGSSRPRDRTPVSHIGGRRFNLWATREAPYPSAVTFLPSKSFPPCRHSQGATTKYIIYTYYEECIHLMKRV